jgi:hypothetical protein
MASKSAAGVVPGTSKIVLKRRVEHMTGKRMTNEQAEAHQSLGGSTQLKLIRELCLILENDFIDSENETVMEELHRLYKLLDGIVTVSV